MSAGQRMWWSAQKAVLSHFVFRTWFVRGDIAVQDADRQQIGTVM